MSHQNKNRFRPIFKQLIKLRENIQNRQKLLKFQKKKWRSFLKFYKNKLRNFRKFKSLDQSKYFVTKYGTRGAGYNKRFRDTLHAGKRLRLFYGNLLSKYFKRKAKLALKKKYSNLRNKVRFEINLLQIFESRLDTVLYRTKFVPTLKSARQLILHGKVFVNNKQVKTKAYLLKKGDVISLDLKCLALYEGYAVDSMKWPIPPKHLVINYKTLQILFLDNIDTINLANEFLFNLRLSKVLINYPKQ